MDKQDLFFKLITSGDSLSKEEWEILRRDKELMARYEDMLKHRESESYKQKLEELDRWFENEELPKIVTRTGFMERIRQYIVLLFRTPLLKAVYAITGAVVITLIGFLFFFRPVTGGRVLGETALFVQSRDGTAVRYLYNGDVSRRDEKLRLSLLLTENDYKMGIVFSADSAGNVIPYKQFDGKAVKGITINQSFPVAENIVVAPGVKRVYFFSYFTLKLFDRDAVLRRVADLIKTHPAPAGEDFKRIMNRGIFDFIYVRIVDE